jgi:hypothetical protein
VVTVWEDDDTRITQTVAYKNGDDFIRYDWAIQNISDTQLSDLRFFHGQDTCMGGGTNECDAVSDTGAGLWFPEARAVGVRNVTGSTERRFYLQGVTPPEAYESRDPGDVTYAIKAGALTNVLNTDPDQDNGYALEWRMASLDADAVWTITAYERFAVQPFDSVFVVAPPLTEIDQGASEDLIYTLTNDDAAGVDVDLSVSKDQSTWDATLQGATTVNVPANDSITVTVRVTVPFGASVDATGVITLTADGPAAGVSADRATVKVTAGGPNATGTGDLKEILTTFPANSVMTYTVSASGGTNVIVWNTVTITAPDTMFDVVQSNNRDVQPTIYRVILPVIYKNANFD